MSDLIDKDSAIETIMKLREGYIDHDKKEIRKGYWELTAAMAMIKQLPSVQLEPRDDLVSKTKFLDFISDMEKSLHYDDLVNKIIMATTNCIKKYLDIISTVKPEEITK